MLNKDKPINSFVISNLKDMNYYVLTAATKEQCDTWLEAVKKSIEAAKTVVAEVEVPNYFYPCTSIYIVYRVGEARSFNEEGEGKIIRIKGRQSHLVPFKDGSGKGYLSFRF